MSVTLTPVWDLDTIFPGGSDSKEYREHVQQIREDITLLSQQVTHINLSSINLDEWAKLFINLEKLQKEFREASAFVSCLSAQDVKDEQANLLVAERSDLLAEMEGLITLIDQKVAGVPEKEWEELISTPELKELDFVLREKRDKAQKQLSKEVEMLKNDLSVDGYHAWNQMYGTIVGKMNVELEEDGEIKAYSVGQAANKANHPDRKNRKYVFDQMSKAWKKDADLISQTLNHLAGFRLQTYKHYGWDNVLKEPLEKNRMKQETLDAMWGAIERNKHHFVKYLDRKAELLELDKLSVYDIGAPIGKKEEKKSYSDGAAFIVNHFAKFSPKMADFAQMAFEKNWIEAEDRPGKRPGGFCTSFPNSEQTRIFMTYSGTSSNIATLAHELGHAYHQHVMNDVNGLNQRYAMNVAETASTFAEMIVADASVQSAATKEEKRSQLEVKIQRSIAFFMNIHARFLFETRFYEERKKGMVSVDRLNQLMVEAQKEAYCDRLDEYDPNFWASKMHFHITGVPFYNFPYTFGYLFSLGIYKHAQEKGGSFEDDYIVLLRDTGRMSVEELAQKHLHVDLTKDGFWEEAISLCVEDVETFLQL
ncbi:M3 family oligoendopeptidase [Oceanobacillus kimchii]|uniref:Oligoendopeptidase n=1 Tax=Oceanobacillus kimchii TaxID=746691 RepID=A0ABQ5TI74_9BACI|nr:M3 family oligoendopeptidase [Oceanobacillus kimchii]GLO65812.1 oligoendopeptidase [Oceanobacillus kimchii]